MCAVVVTGVARSNTWRLRIAAKSSIASGAPLRFWGGGLGVLLALGVWYSTAGASVRMVGAGGGGGPCATAGRIFSARFESSRVLTGFVLLFCFFVQVFVASASNALPSMTDAHKFNSEAADRRRQMAPSGCACKQCGVVSNHTPKHFQQMECLCDDCYTAQYVATEELE